MGIGPKHRQNRQMGAVQGFITGMSSQVGTGRQTGGFLLTNMTGRQIQIQVNSSVRDRVRFMWLESQSKRHMATRNELVYMAAWL